MRRMSKRSCERAHQQMIYPARKLRWSPWKTERKACASKGNASKGVLRRKTNEAGHKDQTKLTAKLT